LYSSAAFMHIQGNLNADSSERALFGSPVNEGGMISMAASGVCPRRDASLRLIRAATTAAGAEAPRSS
jgi:hypothetical protein